MDKLSIEKKVCACIPSKYGKFNLSLFTSNQDNKEHLLISLGSIENADDILVRIHSECFTGDLLGSLRCDCGEQFHKSMEQIATEGKGLIIYLRQEGRGVGLAGKLQAYNLQDQGEDTVNANLKLGFAADERSYDIAACILKTLKIKSLRLLTNNPHKVEELKKHQLIVNKRIPITGAINDYNASYLLTKSQKMKHVFTENEKRELLTKINSKQQKKSIITLSYAQSLDGSICKNNDRLVLSGNESMVLTHKLRSENDGILVGINTIIIDDPQLTVRYVKGENPQPIILDTTLRIPLSAKILKNSKKPIIFTSDKANQRKKLLLTQMGIKIFVTDCDPTGKLNLPSMLKQLEKLSIKKLMIEGGREIITSFLNKNLVDRVIITIAPIFVGGLPALTQEIKTEYNFPKLKNIVQYKLGDDLILQGEIERGS